jgi:hypothetical protein
MNTVEVASALDRVEVSDQLHTPAGLLSESPWYPPCRIGVGPTTDLNAVGHMGNISLVICKFVPVLN